MKSTDSIWKDECPSSQTYPSLTQHTETDVVIVGGGISGITAAYMLAKKGKKVVLVEKNNIGDGVTGYTTAFITYVIDKPLIDIAAAIGKADAKKIWQAGKNGIDFIERVIDEEKLQCEFMRCSASVYAPDQKGANRLKQEAELAQELGFDVDFHTDNQLPIPHKAYIVIHNQAKFQPLLYLQGLAAAAVKAGVKIYEHTNADEVQEKDSITVRCGDVNVYAEHAIMTTQYPFGGPLTMAAKLLPYNSYVITATIPAGIIAEGLYWDTETPYHYVRVDKKNKYARLIIGGEDHKTGQTPQGRSPYAELEKYMGSILGGANYTITNAWSSQVLNTVDGLPYIGAMPFTRQQLLATGYNGTGMAYSTVAALINTDIILGIANQDTSLYSPSRLKGLTNMIGHTADSFAQFFKGMTTKRDHNAEVKPDEGKIIEVNGKKIAIYRDAQGKVIKLSPVCTHMGCIVQWNGNEKTWDCPCHGSRFDATGNVIEGPAQKPLPRMDDH